jgi:hypothetical protein
MIGMKYFKYISIYLAFLFLSLSCEDRSNITNPEELNTGDADFSKFVTIGNSLTAGFQNGALYESAQNYSFGSLIAAQVGSPFVQPTITDPGIGGRIELVSFAPLSTSTNDLVGGLPNNSDYDGIYNNLGIPGALLTDIINAAGSQTAADRSNLFFEIVLRNKGTVLEQVKIIQPTIAFLWIGNNDILGYATSGGISSYTPEDNFAVLYNELCSKLSEQEFDIFAANIPNVRAIPFFTTVAPAVGLNLKELVASEPSIQGLVYQISTHPYLETASAEDLIDNKILLTLRSSSAAAYIGDTEGKYYKDQNIEVPDGVETDFPFGISAKNPFPNNLVLDIKEQEIIENVISSYNATISAVLAKYGYYLVDINQFFNEVSLNGYISNGIEFSTEFISGGLFSLDGVHPSSQGYAVVANEFIKSINDNLSADIPLINVATVPGSLELAKQGSYFRILKSDFFDFNAFKYTFY